MKLRGLKVIDLSWFLPGPFLTMALGDHGAEVIKVEPPGEGDPGRHIAPAIRFHHEPATPVLREPLPGEHTAEILARANLGRRKQSIVG